MPIKDTLLKPFRWFRQTSTRNKVIATAVILLFLGLVLPRLIKPSQATPAYQTATVERGTLLTTLTENGNVEAGSVVNVVSPTTGVIEVLYVKNGDQVATGQKLFQVTSTATAQEKAAAYASYQSAVANSQTSTQNKQSLQAQLEQARATILTNQNTVDAMNKNLEVGANNPATKQPYTQNEIDAINSALTSARENFTAIETKYKQADTAIAASNASLNSAWLAYQNTQNAVVTAPLAGTVANLGVRVGDQVNGSSNSNNSNNATSSTSTTSLSSSTVLMIGNFGTPYVAVAVSEVDVPSLTPGQKATITLDAFPDKTFVGEVAQIDRIGTINSGVVSFTAMVNFVNAPADILPGMSATVVIQTNRKDDVLVIPNGAVQTTDGQSTVRVLHNGQVTSVPVETGLKSDTQTEIISGLNEGDMVVTNITSTTTGGQPASPFGGGFRVGGGFGGGAARTGGGNVVRMQSPGR